MNQLKITLVLELYPHLEVKEIAWNRVLSYLRIQYTDADGLTCVIVSVQYVKTSNGGNMIIFQGYTFSKNGLIRKGGTR